MTLSEREQFVALLLITNNSPVVKKLPSSVRVAILRYVRDKKYPAITNDEWKQMATDIDKVKADAKSLFMEGFMKNPLKIKEDKSLLELDRAVHENIDNIDLDDLAKDADLGSDLSPENDALRKAKAMKKDYDEKR